MSRQKCSNEWFHAPHFQRAERDCAGRVLEPAFDCPGVWPPKVPEPEQLPLDRLHGYPRPGAIPDDAPRYLSTFVQGNPRDGHTWQMVGVWHNNRETAHRRLSGRIMHSPLRADEHPMVLLTPDAVIETLNAALRRDEEALRTDPLVHRLAAMLERWRRTRNDEEERELDAQMARLTANLLAR